MLDEEAIFKQKVADANGAACLAPQTDNGSRRASGSLSPRTQSSTVRFAATEAGTSLAGTHHDGRQLEERDQGSEGDVFPDVTAEDVLMSVAPTVQENDLSNESYRSALLESLVSHAKKPRTISHGES